MKSICWITSGYLLQVDLPILHKLNDKYNIKWIVYADENSDKGKFAKQYADRHKISIEFLKLHSHRYLPFSFFEYQRHLKYLGQLGCDLYYFNIIAFPYMIFAIKKYIAHEKVVMAMHHGKIHNGMQLRHIYKYYLAYLCKQDFYFQYFSNTQANYFTGDKKRRFVIPLALNDFGTSAKYPPKDYVQFLSFGHIIETKNIGLLIQAACKLKEHCKIPFKVKIVGHCRTWKTTYQQLIKYPEIFDLCIESIPDEDIPDLFSSSHYLILPYKSVTQSGPLRIAYGYNLPVITSDLDGFKESVVEGVTGLMFKSEDVDSLFLLMQKCIEMHPDIYNEIRKKQKDYVDKELSIDAVVEKYIDMFNHIDESTYEYKK